MRLSAVDDTARRLALIRLLKRDYYGNALVKLRGHLLELMSSSSSPPRFER